MHTFLAPPPATHARLVLPHRAGSAAGVALAFAQANTSPRVRLVLLSYVSLVDWYRRGTSTQKAVYLYRETSRTSTESEAEW